MASEAAMTLTADSKADRKYAVNTQFLHRSCAYFRQSSNGVKIRLFPKIRSRNVRKVRKIGIISGVADDVRQNIRKGMIKNDQFKNQRKRN